MDAHRPRLSRSPVAMVGILFALALIGTATLFPAPGAAPSSGLCILCGKFGLTDFVLNTILFAPLGSALRGMGLRNRACLALVLACTSGIEILQMGVIDGRDASLGDIIANTLGGAMGIAAVAQWRAIASPSPRAAGALTGGAWLVWTAVAVVTAWSLQPAHPQGTMRLLVRPTLRGFAPFAGSVQAVRLNGVEVPPGPVAGSNLLRRHMSRDGLRIELRATPDAAGRATGALVAITTGTRDPAALVAKAGTHVVFAGRLRANELKLRSPYVVLRDAFSLGTRAALPTEIGVESRRSAVTLRAASGGRAHATTVRFGPDLGWILIAPGAVWLGEADDWPIVLTSALWIALLAFPSSFWAAQAGVRWSAARGVIVGAGSIASTWLLLPLGTAAAAPASASWVGLAVGAVTGILMSRGAARTNR